MHFEVHCGGPAESRRVTVAERDRWEIRRAGMKQHGYDDR